MNIYIRWVSWWYSILSCCTWNCYWFHLPLHTNTSVRHCKIQCNFWWKQCSWLLCCSCCWGGWKWTHGLSEKLLEHSDFNEGFNKWRWKWMELVLPAKIILEYQQCGMKMEYALWQCWWFVKGNSEKFDCHFSRQLKLERMLFDLSEKTISDDIVRNYCVPR